MLRNGVFHNLPDPGMASQTIILAGQVQHRFVLATMNAMAYLAVIRSDRAMNILANLNIIMTDQAKFAAGLQHKLRQASLVWTVATGATLFKRRMRIHHPFGRILVALQTEAGFLFNQFHRTRSWMLLVCRIMTGEAITYSNWFMNVFCPAQNSVTLSGDTAVSHGGISPQDKAFARRVIGKSWQGQNR
jgi:hypothetical protein